MSTIFKKGLATIAAAALISATPGFGMAANFTAGAAKGIKVVPGAGGAAGLGAVGAMALTGNSLLAPGDVNLTGALSGIPAITVHADVNREAVQANAVIAIAAAAAANVQQSGESKGIPVLTRLGKSLSKTLELKAADYGKMGVGDARSTGRKIMDVILGRRTGTAGGSVGVEGTAPIIRNEARGLRPATVKMAAPDSDGVDPQSTEALAAPGLDGRMTPLVDLLREEITSSKTKSDKLGHLLWTLEEMISKGGVVRYAYTYDPATGAPLPGFFNPSEKALYVNDTLQRADLRLQAAVFAGLLQQAYDHINDRAAGTQESAVRQILARDAFLEGADMIGIADSVDIGNVVSVELMESTLQARLWAASGMSALERVFGQNVSIHHLVQRGKDHVQLLKRELSDLVDQLGLFENGLRDDKGNEGYQRQIRVIKEKIGIKKGNISVASAQLKMAESEQGSPDTLLTPLAVSRAHTSRLEKKLKTVPVKARAKVDGHLQQVLDLIARTVRESKDPAIKRLAYIQETVTKLLDSGGHIQFAAPGDGAAAYFSPVTLDVVIGREFAKTHPALIAALMVHELTHAADYFGVPQDKGDPWLQRPLTRETERNAFTNEAIFIGAFDPEELAGHLNVSNPMEHSAYQLVYHARMKYVEGKTSLEAMISDAYRELFGAHFSGLQTAAQLKAEIATSKLAKIVESYEDLRQRTELTQKAVDDGQETRRIQLLQMRRALEMYEAYITVYTRQIQQMELEDAAAEDGGEPVQPSGFQASAKARIR